MWGWPALLKGVVVTYIESDDVINWSAHVSINGGDSWLPTLERALTADDAEPVAGGAVAPASKSIRSIQINAGGVVVWCSP